MRRKLPRAPVPDVVGEDDDDGIDGGVRLPRLPGETPLSTTDAAPARSASAPPAKAGLLRAGGRRTTGVFLLAGALLLMCVLSLRIGASDIPTGTVLRALTDFDGSSDHLVVWDLRVPRTLIGVAVGAALAVAGGIMQAVTRNPLAGPGILGINAGAAFAIVTAVFLLDVVSPTGYIWFAFLGALLTTLLVYGVGSAGRSGATPVKLALSGVVVTALLGSWTSTVMAFDQRTLEEVRFWLAGSLIGRDLDTFLQVSPFLLAGIVLGLLTARQLNALSLGEDVASVLGQRTKLVRLVCAALVVVLAGSAVAAAGPIGFVGLAVPHIARALVGVDYRWVLPYAALLGSTLLLGADILGRVVFRPSELEVGIITAIVGAPFLIYLARRRKLASL